MEKISIILPVYNVENYLDQCLQSILNQSYPHFELIIINDGSTDNSGAIAQQYADKDERITLIHQENQGLSMARNNGLKTSRTDYVLFVDSDDYLHLDYLKIVYHNLIEYGADVSVANHQPIDEDDPAYGQVNPPIENSTKVLDHLAAVNEIVGKSDTNMIIACGKLYKKELFKNIEYPKGKYHEDEFVTYKLLYRSKKVVVTDAKLYFYTQRKASITGNRYSLKRLAKLEGLKEAIDFFEEHNEKELTIKARARYLLNIQIAYYKVKYEMDNQHEVLNNLKKEYDTQYQILMQAKKQLSIFQRIIFRLFKATPNIYIQIVRISVAIKEFLKL